MEDHPFRKLIRIAEGRDASEGHQLSPRYQGILEHLTDGPLTADQLGVPTRMLLALCNAGYVSFEGVSPRSKDALWSLKNHPITEDEMMSRQEVTEPSKTTTDGTDSPFSKKPKRRGLSPRAAKALFSK